MKILITGVAGFIGMHLALELAKYNHEVVGIDNLQEVNYEQSLKYARLRHLKIKDPQILQDGQSVTSEYLTFIKLDLNQASAIEQLILEGNFDVIVNLAALAGVRLSTSIPRQYLNSNVNGFFNILDSLRQLVLKSQSSEQGIKIPRLVFASSSSVYGDCLNTPFKESDTNINQVSVYAATKKMNETLAYTYASLFNLQIVGLRFFTVYGPYSRPDMAAIIFTKAILQDKEITLFNAGKLSRDFTYVQDIVSGIRLIVEQTKTKIDSFDSNHDKPVPYELYNIGSGNPIELADFVLTLENIIGKKAKIRLEKMQKGDVHQTYADVSKLKQDYGFQPQTKLQDGLQAFYDWYIEYYGKN